jgi:hypothetical protein
MRVRIVHTGKLMSQPERFEVLILGRGQGGLLPQHRLVAQEE